jgi:hypothetical protein
MEWYGTQAEFYDREVKAGVLKRQAYKKPDNQYRRPDGNHAFIIWFPARETAQKYADMAKSGEMWIDGFIALYESFLPLEKAA